jgi:hypothetical protein
VNRRAENLTNLAELPGEVKNGGIGTHGCYCRIQGRGGFEANRCYEVRRFVRA